jgi:hypothetical protein
MVMPPSVGLLSLVTSDMNEMSLDRAELLQFPKLSAAIQSAFTFQQALYHDVLKFYKTIGMRIRRTDIPLQLVEWRVLNGAQEPKAIERSRCPGKPLVSDWIEDGTRGSNRNLVRLSRILISLNCILHLAKEARRKSFQRI